MSVRGGKDRFRFSVSGGYLDQDGIIRNTSFERFTSRANLEWDLSSRVLMGVNVNFTKSTNYQVPHSQRSGNVGNNVVLSALISHPLDNLTIEEVDEDSLRDNPLTLTERMKDVMQQWQTVANAFVNVKILRGLSFKGSFGVNSRQGSRAAYYPRGTATGDTYAGLAARSEASRFNYRVESTFTYDAKIKRHHKINAVAGFTWQHWNVSSLSVRVGSFPNDEIGPDNLGMGLSQEIPKNSETNEALASFLARVNYNYADRYLFTVSARADGSSRLAAGNRWAIFPSAAFAWRINKERFLRNVKEISNLKLKLSYGMSGNRSISIGSIVNRYVTDRYPFDGETTSTLRPGSLANPYLGWETTAQWNVGLEMGFLKNRFTLNMDVYQKDTYDLLLNIPVPLSSGYATYPVNAGSVRNRGIEIEAKADIFTGKFGWSVGANFSLNRNRVMNLAGIDSILGSDYISSGGITLNQPLHIAMEGYPIGSFYGYMTDGIYQNYAEVAAGPEKYTAQPGDVRYVDYHKDGKIDSNDITVIGNPEPDFILGLSTDLNWKGITLSMLFQANIGGEIANLNRYILDANTLVSSRNISVKAWENRWQGEGTGNYYPRLQPSTQATLFSQRFSDFFLEDASFLRLKTLTLSYRLPLKKVKWMRRVELFATATNLFTLTDYTGYDPEVSSAGSSALTPAVDFGTYPMSRTFSMGLNLGF